MEEENMQVEEEMSQEDILNNTEYVLNALIDLLIDKGVITEGELDAKLEEDDEDEDEEGSEEE